MNGITLRKATIDDMELTFNWRNAPENYKCFISREGVDKHTHIEWFNKILNDDKRYLLIAEIDRKPVGVLRYDIINDDSAEISIHLKPGITGKGIGTEIIVTGSTWLKHYAPYIKNVIANIIPTNIPSQKAFAKAGFLIHHLCLMKSI